MTIQLQDIPDKAITAIVAAIFGAFGMAIYKAISSRWQNKHPGLKVFFSFERWDVPDLSTLIRHLHPELFDKPEQGVVGYFHSLSRTLENVSDQSVHLRVTFYNDGKANYEGVEIDLPTKGICIATYETLGKGESSFVGTDVDCVPVESLMAGKKIEINLLGKYPSLWRNTFFRHSSGGFEIPLRHFGFIPFEVYFFLRSERRFLFVIFFVFVSCVLLSLLGTSRITPERGKETSRGNEVTNGDSKPGIRPL